VVDECSDSVRAEGRVRGVSRSPMGRLRAARQELGSMVGVSICCVKGGKFSDFQDRSAASCFFADPYFQGSQKL
jgi:hypothetical protein